MSDHNSETFLLIFYKILILGAWEHHRNSFSLKVKIAFKFGEGDTTFKERYIYSKIQKKIFIMVFVTLI